jgi:transaldolase
MTDTSLHQLNGLGQSVWLDSISRDWLDGGDLERMVDELGIVGVTSNPTIFAQALTSSTYDDEIRQLAGDGLDDRDIFERLAVADIQRACDVLAPVAKRTGGVDGKVSIELEPDLAHDPHTSIERGRHLWNAVDRDNLLIKVPATDEGLPVIEALLAEGIDVNVTLLFSVGVYRKVMDAYLRALEHRLREGLPLGDIHSVASFFVSRVDSKVDAALPDGHELAGHIANDNAIAAWDAYNDVFTGPRWAALTQHGARPQRPLWASTGTKNPAYSDILYVQQLIAPGTVNTMPLKTLEAFADHGEARVTITDTAPSHARLARLADLGIDLDEVTGTLRAEGVASFQASFEELLETIGSRRAQLV